jgi:hypothetical protein
MVNTIVTIRKDKKIRAFMPWWISKKLVIKWLIFSINPIGLET